MKFTISSFFFFTILAGACGQEIPQGRPQLTNPAFDNKLVNLLDFTVPLIGVKELKNIQDEVYVFDTRNEEEYEVSHIPGASFLGYKSFDPGMVQNLSKSDTIVLYCSVGYRSEKIGKRLIQMGYIHVFNLYGSIFEWTNQNYPLVDKSGKATHQVHTYNQNWSQWIEDGKAEKIW